VARKVFKSELKTASQ